MCSSPGHSFDGSLNLDAFYPPTRVDGSGAGVSADLGPVTVRLSADTCCHWILRFSGALVACLAALRCLLLTNAGRAVPVVGRPFRCTRLVPRCAACIVLELVSKLVASVRGPFCYPTSTVCCLVRRTGSRALCCSSSHLWDTRLLLSWRFSHSLFFSSLGILCALGLPLLRVRSMGRSREGRLYSRSVLFVGDPL